MDVDALLELLEGAGPLPSREIQARLGVSQATASRLLRRAEGRIARIGRGRATRYAALHLVLGDEPWVPVFRVTRTGVVEEIARLSALAGGGYLVEADGAPFWLLGRAGSGHFPSLPYFLLDLRPAGFLGRAWARRLADQLGFPRDPRRWTDPQIGHFLLHHGEDLPGDLILGSTTADRARLGISPPVTDEDYSRLALEAIGDGPIGSSAGGEQPKFLARHDEGGPVIVKFSPPGSTPEALRWRDLLRAEHAAARLLAELDVPTAVTRILPGPERTYLESRRFDREGARGRNPALSLEVVDAEFAGAGPGWSRIADALLREGLLDRRSRDRIAWLELFGAWIGNTDMHPGNLCLTPAEAGFRLLPAFDMLPMAFAPVHGELPEPELRPPVQTRRDRDAWFSAGKAAVRYWSALAEEPDLEGKLREAARRIARSWRGLLGR